MLNSYKIHLQRSNCNESSVIKLEKSLDELNQEYEPYFKTKLNFPSSNYPAIDKKICNRCICRCKYVKRERKATTKLKVKKNLDEIALAEDTCRSILYSTLYSPETKNKLIEAPLKNLQKNLQEREERLKNKGK